MRRTLVAHWTRRIVPAAAAVALAAGLPYGAEARTGGGGVGLGGLGGFHGGGGFAPRGGFGPFSGGFGPLRDGGFALGGGFAPGGFAPVGVVVVPLGAVGVVGAAQRGAIGVFSTAQRRAIGVFSTAQREALGFRNGGVVVLRGGHAFPHGDVFAFSSGHHYPHGDGHGHRFPHGYNDSYHTVGIPPLLGTSVPPLATATAPRSGGSAGPRPVRSDVGVVEVWRRDGEAWRLDPTPPQSVAVWRRGDVGRWRAETAD